MNGGEINPIYEVVPETDTFGIFGREETTGETVFIKQLSKERKTADYLAKILNKNKVSVHHAKDVLRDFLIDPVLK